ncbi:ABC transporter substrate binding protein [Vibrio sp. SCSIO 43136]|uniref:ABC transporter substrate binding protein n=1 Tax=Vibrio sp. SCSIO 43136 TaxID=2819101 RepID=UPI002075ECFD|nr:ABC transporter substrate binding protein [Vibrio sp. SCSIO 43136]USD67065.1 EAL domain-containing protein [Vibrio sp. SCSIO 43136]
MHRLINTLICCLLLAFSSATLAASELADKRVLLLFSYHPSFPSSPKVLNGVDLAFGEDSPVIDIEYMDSKRLNDSQSQQNFLAMFGYKLSKRSPYDVVMTADDNALHFALEHRASLFPNTPVVFLGVNNLQLAASLEATPWITGVVEAASFAETISLASTLMPKRNNIHVVVDDRVSGQSDLATVQSLYEQFPMLKFHELPLADLTWQEFANNLNRLGENDALLLLSAFQDSLKVEKSFYEALALMVNGTDVPILHTWEHGIGEGVLGGVTVSHLEQGRQAALMVKTILSGTSPANIPIMDKSPNVPTFDYRELERYQLSQSVLPPNSLVLFEPQSFMRTYLMELSAVALVFTILVISALYLVRKNYLMKQLSNKLKEKSSFLRLLMDTLPDLVWIKDRDGVYLTCNKRFEEFFGATESEIKGKTDYDFVDKELADFFREKDLLAMEAGGLSVNEETISFSSDGHQEVLETVKSPVYEKHSNQLLGVLGVGRDITERKRSEDRLRLSASVFESSAEGVVITNADTEIVEINKAFTELTGYSRKDVIGRTPKMFQSGKHDKPFYAQMWQSILEQGSWSGELINRKKDGGELSIWQTISAVKDSHNVTTHYVSVFSDISELKASQQEAQYLAFHDPLTDLPNRRMMKEYLADLVEYASLHHQSFTVMYMDLDNFKNVNDSFGHPEGDSLLTVVSKYLSDKLRDEDIVARIGGDEFVLIFQDVSELSKAEMIADKILHLLRDLTPLESHAIGVTASIGVCIYPQDGDNVDDLLRNADTAMYQAKNAGKNTYRFYSQESTTYVKERTELETDLRNSVHLEQLLLHYQPQFHLSTHQVTGIEALVRWNHPIHGMIGPDKFIPIAEESGFIDELGEWVLNAALAQAKVWLDMGVDFGKVAVNLSTKQLEKIDLIQVVKLALTRSQFPAEKLTLEVTESSIMENKASAVSILTTLESWGIEIAIDDFGTGYSSLSYLKQLPIQKLKLDKSFIFGIPQDSDAMVICKTVMALGDSLKVRVIAEGVESLEQAKFLTQIGCQEVQGFYYSRPLTVEQFEADYCQPEEKKA